jgi:hypothetical protein
VGHCGRAVLAIVASSPVSKLIVPGRSTRSLDVISATTVARNQILVAAVLVLGLFACSSSTSQAGRVYTLYRNSIIDANMRIHVATFNADADAQYNSDNCDQARELFQSQPGVKTRFWCEKGEYRK